MVLPLLGGLLAGGFGLLGASKASKATQAANREAAERQEAANAAMLRDKQLDREYQEKFARSGVQWRAEDAKKAGIHPLYALGATGASYTPSAVSVGTAPIAADTSMGTAVASMGQDIGRAMNSTRSGEQRLSAFDTTVQGLTLQKMGLENALLASQIKRLQVNANPAFPSTPSDAALKVAGVGVKKDPNWSNAEDLEARYGEFVSDLIGPVIGWNDFINTTGGAGLATSSWPKRVSDAVQSGGSWLDRNVKVVPRVDTTIPFDPRHGMPWHHQ